jgi:hypothetical protein
MFITAFSVKNIADGQDHQPPLRSGPELAGVSARGASGYVDCRGI